MRSVQARIGLLGGIVAFCVALLSGLLQHSRPLSAMRKAALSAAVLAVVTWVCACIALSLMSDAARGNVRR